MRIDLSGNLAEAVRDSRTKTVAGGTKPPTTVGTTAGGTAGEVEFTSRSAAVIAAKLSDAPDIRWEKVAPLKQAIQQGRYTLSSEMMADAMVKEWFGGR